jgi:pimeloyl-ACP methyl ester carboxylesterase
MMDVIEHKYVDSDGGKIHYAAAGSGPLVVFVHGFPDFWYSWNHQMAGLMDSHRVVASIRAGTTGAANRRTKKTTT